MTHEELNRVRNIFRDCCLIWSSMKYESTRVKSKKKKKIRFRSHYSRSQLSVIKSESQIVRNRVLDAESNRIVESSDQCFFWVTHEDVLSDFYRRLARVQKKDSVRRPRFQWFFKSRIYTSSKESCKGITEEDCWSHGTLMLRRKRV